jgi:BirA family biotin operon repressor/biotin-[acetyl-CoA-carboxylase] ligase
MPTAVLAEQWEEAPPESWRQAWRLPELHIFQQASSTNDVIRRAALAGAPAGTTAIADFQTGGRGRLGRPWVAPAGAGLLLSVLCRPDPGGSAEAAGALPIRVGLAVARALRSAANITIALKWPNDILAEGAKLGGILCEAAGDFVVAGIGINVHQQAADFPPEVRSEATSLRLVTGLPCSRARVAGEILQELRRLFQHRHEPLETSELLCFAAADALAGRRVAVDGQLAGVAAGIDRLGGLLVQAPGGSRVIHAGTVRVVP